MILCVDGKGFSTLSDGCHGNKGNSISAVLITSNEKMQFCRFIHGVKCVHITHHHTSLCKNWLQEDENNTKQLFFSNNLQLQKLN